jgi:hypothetical protein
MDDDRLATDLLNVIAPGDAMVRRMIAVGEPVLAVATLLEMAVERRQRVPQGLIDEMQTLVDDGALDDDDTLGAREDLAMLSGLHRVTA